MSTSRLQQQTVKSLDRIFGCHAVQENVRPDWLIGPNGHRLELDVFIPSAKIAIEVQGVQHYRFNEHFHGSSDGFARQVAADSQKRVFCRRKGITLYEVASESDLSDVIAQIKGKPQRPDPKYVEAQRRERIEKSDRHVEWFTRPQQRKLDDALRELEYQRSIQTPETLATYETAQDLLRAESRVKKRQSQLERAQERVRADVRWKGSDSVIRYRSITPARVRRVS